MNEEFTMIKENEEDVAKFTIIGRITTTTANEFDKRLDDELFYGLNNIILNMSQVTLLTSTGLRVILKTYKKAENAGGRLQIEAPSENVRKVLELSMLEQMLII